MSKTIPAGYTTTIHTTYLMDSGELRHFKDEVDFELETYHILANIERDVAHAQIHDEKIMLAQLIIIPDGVYKDAVHYVWSDNSRKLTGVV